MILCSDKSFTQVISFETNNFIKLVKIINGFKKSRRVVSPYASFIVRVFLNVIYFLSVILWKRSSVMHKTERGRYNDCSVMIKKYKCNEMQ